MESSLTSSALRDAATELLRLAHEDGGVFSVTYSIQGALVQTLKRPWANPTGFDFKVIQNYLVDNGWVNWQPENTYVITEAGIKMLEGE